MTYGISLNNNKLTSFESFQKETYFYLGKVNITFRNPEPYRGNYSATVTLSESNVPVEDLIFVVGFTKSSSSKYSGVYVSACVVSAELSGRRLVIQYGTTINYLNSNYNSTYAGYIMVFRKRSALNKGNWGIELFAEGGSRYFSSTDYPLVTCESSAPYSAMHYDRSTSTSTLRKYTHIGYVSRLLNTIIYGNQSGRYFTCILGTYRMAINGNSYALARIGTNFTALPNQNPITINHAYSGTTNVFMNTYPYL